MKKLLVILFIIAISASICFLQSMNITKEGSQYSEKNNNPDKILPKISPDLQSLSEINSLYPNYDDMRPDTENYNNWQTLVHKEDVILMMPPGWVAHGYDNNNKDRIFFYRTLKDLDDEKQLTIPKSQMVISFEGVEENKPLEDWLKESLGLKDLNVENPKDKKSIFGIIEPFSTKRGYPGYWFYEGTTGNGFYIAYLKLDNKIAIVIIPIKPPFENELFWQIIESIAEIKDHMKLSYLSPSQKYSFNAFGSPYDVQKCLFNVTDKESGEYINIAEVLGFNKINCGFELLPYSYFYRWQNDKKFILSEDGKIPVTLNLNDMTTSTYDSDNNELIFSQVDLSLKYWLFRKGHLGSFVLLDSNKNILSEFEKIYDRPALYDAINNGFLFINRIDDYQDGVFIEFDYLSLDNLLIRNVLTTKPVPARGMECYPEQIISKNKGEIILSRGCLTVGQEYLDESGNINIDIDSNE